MTLTVFRAGNSNVVAIPRHMLEAVDIKPGQKVIVERAPDDSGIIIRKSSKAKIKSGRSKKEFDAWWKMFERENGGILDDLA